MPINKIEGQKKNGQQKYRVRYNYTDAQGKAHQIERTAYGLAEAKDLELTLRAEYGKNELTAKKTVNKLYEEYIKHQTYQLRESSLQKTKTNLKTHVLPYLKDIRLDKLTPQLINQWKITVAEKGNMVSTNRNAYKELRALLNYAVKNEYIQSNPINKVDNFKDAYSTNVQEKLKYYTKEEFLIYIKYLRDNASTMIDWGVYVFFNIAFYCGLRKGEINALKWSDIEGNKLHVRRSIAQKLKGGDRETPPKNKSSYRTLQMPTPLLKILDEHKKRQQNNYEAFSDDYRVCGGRVCLRDSTIDNKNRLAAEATKLPRIKVHDFRHSHATLLANNGINIQEISRRLGHSNIEMTWNIYSHLYPQEEERALNVLNKIK